MLSINFNSRFDEEQPIFLHSYTHRQLGNLLNVEHADNRRLMKAITNSPNVT